MKKRLLHGVGMALMLASPIWLTIEKPPNYFNFAISLILGVLLLVLGLLSGKPMSTPPLTQPCFFLPHPELYV
jgi:hypothetical protein